MRTATGRGGNLPSPRTDIDPLDLGFVLGNLSLVDVLDQPLRFRLRLQGTQPVQRLGYDLTGRFVDEFPDPEYREVVLRTYRTAVEQRRPVRQVREAMMDLKSRRYEIIVLPLAADGTMIDMLMVCVALLDPN